MQQNKYPEVVSNKHNTPLKRFVVIYIITEMTDSLEES